ncbi:MAG: radical SAM protein, partial [Pseudomonadota bacterium]
VSYEGMKARAAVGPPLGILSIAAYVRESPWQGSISIYDARMRAEFFQADGRLLFGDNDAQIQRRLQEEAPDVIGISNMFSAQIERAYHFADLAREACPSATIVIGGPHVSVFPLEAIERPSIDYVVMGEGEQRMAQLLQSLQAGEAAAIEGVVAKAEDLTLLRANPRAPITFIHPLDELPLPAYDLVDMPAYFRLGAKGFSPRFREWGKRPISMLTSRGCPHRCVFCSIQTTMGYRFRYHSNEYIRRHITHLREEYGVDFIHFEDDNFVHLPERYDEIIDFMLTLDPKIKWDTPNGIRGDAWTRTRVRRAKQSGCQVLIVAIESAVQRVVDDVVKKRLDLARVDELMQYCHDEKLRLHAFYIIGFPGETREEIEQTIAYALDRYRRYGVQPVLQPLIPIPGTDVYDDIMARQLHEGEVRTEYNQVATDDFDPEWVHGVYRHYLRQRLGIFFLRSLTSLSEFAYTAKLLSRYPQGAVDALRNAVRGTS